MKVTRYSKSFKLQVVREVEDGALCAEAAKRKYNIGGHWTVMKWVRRYGSGKIGKIIRVEKAHEVDEAGRLRQELRRVKEALADTQVELALERAFLEVACEQLNQPVEAFKKSKLAGGAPSDESLPGPEGGCGLRAGGDDAAKLLCAPSRQAVEVDLMLALVRAQRKYQPRLGVRKIYCLIQGELRAAGVKMGRDRLFAELGQAGLLVERKPSAWPKTTHLDASWPVFKNLVKRGLLTGRNQAWVADITYVRTRQGFMYLALITDRWSRKIVGFHLGETLAAGESVRALVMALQGLGPREKPIHHSDRGCQYASREYVRLVEKAGLKMSMTEKNHSAENAVAERVNGILKQEYWLDADFGTKCEARRAVAQGIHLYNTRRPHTALGYKTPEVMHGP